MRMLPEENMISIESKQQQQKKTPFTDFTCKSAVRINSHDVPIKFEIVARSSIVDNVLARCFNTELEYKSKSCVFTNKEPRFFFSFYMRFI